MKEIITYGTYDFQHKGYINLYVGQRSLNGSKLTAYQLLQKIKV